jgi:hypothetical protein
MAGHIDNQKLNMTITELAVAKHILIAAVTNLAIYNYMQLGIGHACLYTLIILYLQGCVVKIMLTGIHTRMPPPGQLPLSEVDFVRAVVPPAALLSTTIRDTTLLLSLVSITSNF